MRCTLGTMELRNGSGIALPRALGRRVERHEPTCIGVGRVRHAERDGLVAAGVAEGRAEDDGTAERKQALRDGLDAARRIFAGGGQGSGDEAPGALERAAQEELREQALELVGWLVEVFEEDERVFGARLERGEGGRGK